MAENLKALQIGTGGSSAVGMASSALNTTAQLPGGVYACWASPLTAYIAVGTPPSSGIAGSSNAYPVVGAAAPIMVAVPQNGQISAISTGASVFSYQKVG